MHDSEGLGEPDRCCLMQDKTTLSTSNHTDHFVYENQPFLKPEDGNLPPIEWAFVVDVNLVRPSLTEEEANDLFTRPEYYLQVSSYGEVRGVTHDCDEHEDYFSVTGDMGDVSFLKTFSTLHPNVTPTLKDVMGYRKYRMANLRKTLDQAEHEPKNGFLHLKAPALELVGDQTLSDQPRNR